MQNQKNYIDLAIGIVTRRTLKQLFENGDISQANLDNFFDGARAFFSRAYEYCVKWLPLEDPLLKHCQFLDFEKRSNSSFDCVLRTIENFSNIHAKVIEQPELLEMLEEEF